VVERLEGVQRLEVRAAHTVLRCSSCSSEWQAASVA
jgi:hypothetical protein